MKVSVAMCTFNGAEYLADQLASIARQTLPPLELIVCDDCSEDGTVALLEAHSVSAAYPVKIFVNDSRLGSTRNFEKAIALCSGEAIALSDQDDVWADDKLQTLVDVLAKNENIGAVFSNADVVDEQLKPLGSDIFKNNGFNHREQNVLRSEQYYLLVLTRTFVTGMTMMFRSRYKYLLFPMPDFDKDMIHDRWIAIVIAAVSKIEFVDRPLVLYRQHVQQQIGSSDFNRLAKLKQILLSSLTFSERHDDFYTSWRSLDLVKQRLSLWDSPITPENVRILNENIAHLSHRATLPFSRTQRTKPVIREVLTKRYGRYSRGIGSAVKDWLR